VLDHKTWIAWLSYPVAGHDEWLHRGGFGRGEGEFEDQNPEFCYNVSW